MAMSESVSALLTPPPDPVHLRTTLSKTMDGQDSYPTSSQRRPLRPLDDSSEEEVADQNQDQDHIGALDGLDHASILSEEKVGEIVDETTTTHTTTTTMAKLPKKRAGLKSGLEGLVAHHESVHQKFQTSSPSDDGNGSEIETERTKHERRHSSTAGSIHPMTLSPNEEDTITTKRPQQQQSDATTIRTPSASLATLSTRQPGQSPPLASATTASPLAEDRAKVLLNSSSSSSIASSGPGTPSSVEGYHSISTTSTITTKKRKVRRPTFEARSSRLDPETLSKTQDPFRGFHTLFWIVMGAYGLITFDEEWTRVGKAFGGTLFSSFSQDAIMLTISDLGLVLSTGVAYLLIKAISRGWLRYTVAGMVIQHSVQVLFLLVAIAWTIWRDWPWVQSGFFTLHAITMLMKIHSYIAYNGELSEKLIQLKKNEAAYALIKKADVETVDDNTHTSSNNITNNNDDDAESESVSSSGGNNALSDSSSTDSLTRKQDQDVSRRRHHRLASEAAAALLQDPASNPSAANTSLLASDIDELKNELRCQSGELWPANVTIANFVDYLIVPSLIYELQYPRTSRIRPMYVFEKSVATLGTFTLLYLTTEHYIYPVVFDPTISPLRALVLLLIPFMMNYLMIFYIIFECICNAFAELSRFADRNFYEDWWNCVSFDEWARKWNKPVHHFLLRHVYDSSIESFHLSKSNAALATFFLSSCVHELVMMVVTRKVRLYLFALQMCQLPLIWMGNNKAIREKPRLANAVFWLGMFCGPPLLGVAYCYA